MANKKCPRPISYGMKYSPAIFAKAFSEILKVTPKSEEQALVRNFTSVLKRYGVIKDSDKILKELKKIIAVKEGALLINIESARELDKSNIDKVKKFFNKTSDYTYKINKELIAGIKITINDEISIDSSLQRRLKCMK